MNYRHPNGHRCGWCIVGDHSNCLVVIRLGRKREELNPQDMDMEKLSRRRWIPKPRPTYLWRCECQDEADHPASSCSDCLRPGVDVDETDRCRDRAECDSYQKEFGPFTRPTAYQPYEEHDVTFSMDVRARSVAPTPAALLLPRTRRDTRRGLPELARAMGELRGEPVMGRAGGVQPRPVPRGLVYPSPAAVRQALSPHHRGRPTDQDQSGSGELR